MSSLHCNVKSTNPSEIVLCCSGLDSVHLELRDMLMKGTVKCSAVVMCDVDPQWSGGTECKSY